MKMALQTSLKEKQSDELIAKKVCQIYPSWGILPRQAEVKVTLESKIAKVVYVVSFSTHVDQIETGNPKVAQAKFTCSYLGILGGELAAYTTPRLMNEKEIENLIVDEKVLTSQLDLLTTKYHELTNEKEITAKQKQNWEETSQYFITIKNALKGDSWPITQYIKLKPIYEGFAHDKCEETVQKISTELGLKVFKATITTTTMTTPDIM